MGKTTTIEERRPAAEATIATEVPACQHHWLIETPRGATSHGRCKRCGEEREFRNSATDHLWEDESGSGYNAWRGVKSTPSNASSDDDVSVSAVSGGAVMV
jgi:hypothetical protein